MAASLRSARRSFLFQPPPHDEIAPGTGPAGMRRPLPGRHRWRRSSARPRRAGCRTAPPGTRTTTEGERRARPGAERACRCPRISPWLRNRPGNRRSALDVVRRSAMAPRARRDAPGRPARAPLHTATCQSRSLPVVPVGSGDPPRSRRSTRVVPRGRRHRSPPRRTGCPARPRRARTGRRGLRPCARFAARPESVWAAAARHTGPQRWPR